MLPIPNLSAAACGAQTRSVSSHEGTEHEYGVSLRTVIHPFCPAQPNWKLDLALATFPHWQHSSRSRANIVEICFFIANIL